MAAPPFAVFEGGKHNRSLLLANRSWCLMQDQQRVGEQDVSAASGLVDDLEALPLSVFLRGVYGGRFCDQIPDPPSPQFGITYEDLAS